MVGQPRWALGKEVVLVLDFNINWLIDNFPTIPILVEQTPSHHEFHLHKQEKKEVLSLASLTKRRKFISDLKVGSRVV